MEKERMEQEKAINDAELEQETPEKQEAGEENTVTKEEEKEEVSGKKDDLSEMKDKYLRLYSEFENFRRRTAREKLDLIQNANADLLSDLLPVFDDMERALKASEEGGEATDDGLVLIYSKFKKTLENAGVKEIEAGEGVSFDVEVHEAISQIPAPTKKLKGKVIDVVEKGYFLKEKVLRFAKVVVGS